MSDFNLFAKVDMVKYSGRVVAVNLNDGLVIASAKEKRSIKYDKTKYTNVAILCLPIVQNNPKLINRVAIVLDSSGSMYDIKDSTITTFNNLVNTLKEQSRINNQETTVSLFTFNSIVRENYFNKQIVDRCPPHEEIPKLDRFNYTTNGGTALFDGIGHSIEKFKQLKDGENVSYLIYVITDGDENSSRHFTSPKLISLFKECESLGNFTITLQLPIGSKKGFCSKYGISSDNVREWEATDEGMKQVNVVTTSALAGFYNSRNTGARSVTNFYKDIDLSKITSKDLNKLDDISGQVKIVEVPKECTIKEFVESKTKKPYVIGQGYYQLMKKELVQPQKSVCIYDKKTKCVYAGKQARKLIGLPDGVNCKVQPLNHAGMEIFIKSTSVNRILPRGSKVLIDLMQGKDDEPTWK